MKCKSLIIEIHGKGERREKALLALRQLGFSVVHDIPGNQASVFAMVNPSVGR
jgi:hypothetical protein